MNATLLLWSKHGLVVFALTFLALVSGCGGGGGGGGSPSVAPQITTQPSGQRVTSPATATFAVAATGTPSPSYQWQVSTDGGATFANITGATLATYTTPATIVADSGKLYRAVASNSAGNATSVAATLLVNAGPGSFSAISATMGVPRANHTATRLANGTVLITGGFSSNVLPAPALNTAELFDPTTGTFTALTARMTSTRTNHAATLLPNGQVLLTGGQIIDNNGDGSTGSELYNPATQTFTAITARMVSPRGAHSATLLPNGKVLLAGGFNAGNGTLVSDAELYDPATQTFTAIAGRMSAERPQHAAVLLPTGKVLLIGGDGAARGTSLASSELFDPATQTFSLLSATLLTPRSGHIAALLPSGVVLVAGGGTLNSSNIPASVVLNTVEIFDPASQTFSANPATLIQGRFFFAAASLADGSVFMTGGGLVNPNLTVLSTAEVYRP